MLLQIWSDYACPYCYIGKRFLEQALAGFEHADDVQIVFRAFELDRNASPTVANTTQQRIEKKYRKSPQAAGEMIDHIVALGTRVGLDIKYREVRYTSTFDAHRLTRFAASQGVDADAAEKLFHAYFTETRELADRDVLLSIAVALGLDAGRTRAMLASDDFADAVRSDEAQAQVMGIQSVPFFAFENGPTLSGAQPKAAFLQALRASCKERYVAPATDGVSCQGDACAVPARG